MHINQSLALKRTIAPIIAFNNNNNNFIWVLNFPVSSMDFTNKLIYIYDTQKWNMTILTIRIEKEERKKKKKNHPSLSDIILSYRNSPYVEQSTD